MQNKRKIAIIGTVGIPAKYGGFETLVEYITREINDDLLDLTVYCSSNAYTEKLNTHNNSKLKYINFKANGIQSIPYDIISIIKAIRYADVLLILGVSGAIILPFITLFYKGKIICNIDGLEHKREKWGRIAKLFLKFSEKLAIKYSQVVVTDNKAIQDYVNNEYKKDSELIAYGGDHVEKLQLTDLIKSKYNLPSNYAFKVCRIEPENNVHLIFEAFSKTNINLVIVGNWDNSEYGIKLKETYTNYSNLFILDPIYDQNELNQIRSNCHVYIHGHSAGGTNPSLVEAMHLTLPIFAYDILYNRYTTNNKALYFRDSNELVELLDKFNDEDLNRNKNDMKRIAIENYTWNKIASKYKNILNT